MGGLLKKFVFFLLGIVAFLIVVAISFVQLFEPKVIR